MSKQERILSAGPMVTVKFQILQVWRRRKRRIKCSSIDSNCFITSTFAATLTQCIFELIILGVNIYANLHWFLFTFSQTTFSTSLPSSMLSTKSTISSIPSIYSTSSTQFTFVSVILSTLILFSHH